MENIHNEYPSNECPKDLLFRDSYPWLALQVEAHVIGKNYKRKAVQTGNTKGIKMDGSRVPENNGEMPSSG